MHIYCSGLGYGAALCPICKQLFGIEYTDLFLASLLELFLVLEYLFLLCLDLEVICSLTFLYKKILTILNYQDKLQDIPLL